MDFRDFYHGVEAASHALMPLFEPFIKAREVELGMSRREISILLIVPTYEPGPVSSRLLNISAPYTSPEYYRRTLDTLNQNKMLYTAGGGDYRLTERGLATIKETLNAMYSILAGVQPLPITQMMDLGSRLKDLADACARAPDPPGTWCMRHKRRLDPGSRAPMMARIEQFINELRAYRDDAHIASWRGYKVNGHAWDVLTYLWVENNTSILSINQALSQRGNPIDETLAAVGSLIKKGWVCQSGNGVRITEYGRDIRQIAEDTTDRYFHLPFRSIPEPELERALELINAFRKGIPDISAYM